MTNATASRALCASGWPKDACRKISATKYGRFSFLPAQQTECRRAFGDQMSGLSECQNVVLKAHSVSMYWIGPKLPNDFGQRNFDKVKKHRFNDFWPNSLQSVRLWAACKAPLSWHVTRWGTLKCKEHGKEWPLIYSIYLDSIDLHTVYTHLSGENKKAIAAHLAVLQAPKRQALVMRLRPNSWQTSSLGSSWYVLVIVMNTLQSSLISLILNNLLKYPANALSPRGSPFLLQSSPRWWRIAFTMEMNRKTAENDTSIFHLHPFAT